MNIIGKYYDYLTGMYGKTESTASNYCGKLRLMEKFLQKSIEKSDVSDVNAFLLHLRDQKMSINTRRHYQIVLKAFFTWLSDQTGNDNPAIGIKPMREEMVNPNVLAVDDVKKMILACGNRNYVEMRNAAMIIVMAETGVRVSELTQLRKSHIKLTDTQYILNMDSRIRCKNFKQRQIPFCYLEEGRLATEIFTAFYMMLGSFSHDDYIFIKSPYSYKKNGTPGKPTSFGREKLTSRRVHAIIGRTAEKAGIERLVHPHDFRHFYGTMMAKNQTRLEVLQSFMGHSSVDYTMKYVHLAAATINDASKNNPLKDVKGKVVNESLVKKIRKIFGE
jgi:site-specific recombinase XerD